MSLLVTGSIGIDTVKTPTGKRSDVLGGSAIYFSYAASFFTPVRLVGVVGEDCPMQILSIFEGRTVDTSGLEVRKGSKSFRWHGSYVSDLNEARTIETQLNVLAEKAPNIPAGFCDSSYVFLANTHPVLQQQMLSCLKKPRLVVADTMNLWINTERPELLNLLKRIDGLVLNDGEARMLTEKKCSKWAPSSSSSRRANTAACCARSRKPSYYLHIRPKKSSIQPAPVTASPVA